MSTTVDLVLTAGQSQMSGTCGSLTINPPPPVTVEGMAYDFYEGALVQVADPDSSEGTDYQCIYGSCVPKFCNIYTSASLRPIVVVRAAIGGTALLAPNRLAASGDWSETDVLFDNSVDRVEAALALFPSHDFVLGRIFVIWSQGFRDAVAGKDASGNLVPGDPDPETGHTWPTLRADYAEAQTELLNRWRTALGVPDLKLYIEGMYIPENTPAEDQEERLLVVRKAQDDSIAVSDGGIQIAFDEGATYWDRGFIRTFELPRVHYNQAGLDNMGEVFARYVADDHGLEVPPTPVFENNAVTSGLAHVLRRAKFIPPLPVEYSVPGTYQWKCPAGVTSVDLTGWAAGGGGKGGIPIGPGGGGGGSGQKRVRTGVPVVPGTLYTVVIPDGGNGATYNTGNVAAPSGGDLTFGGTVMICKGGVGGGGTANRNGGAGGTGGTGGVATNGNPGGTAVNSSGSDGGVGGSAPSGGTGGPGGTTGDIVGDAGAAPGAGGGGGKGNIGGGHGGKGAPGKLIIAMS